MLVFRLLLFLLLVVAASTIVRNWVQQHVVQCTLRHDELASVVDAKDVVRNEQSVHSDLDQVLHDPPTEAVKPDINEESVRLV